MCADVMRRGLGVCVLVALAACSGGGGAPERVLVERDRVTVMLGNGWPCVGFRTDETRDDTGWAGQLEGCPASYAYQVHVPGGGRPRRQELVPGGQGAGPSVIIEGGPTGNWRFGAP